MDMSDSNCYQSGTLKKLLSLFPLFCIPFCQLCFKTNIKENMKSTGKTKVSSEETVVFVKNQVILHHLKSHCRYFKQTLR